MKINILYRFKLYKPRNAYRYNNGYLKKETLYKLMYRVNETFGEDVNECSF